jgi:hypothetical protein
MVPLAEVFQDRQFQLLVLCEQLLIPWDVGSTTSVGAVDSIPKDRTSTDLGDLELLWIC